MMRSSPLVTPQHRAQAKPWYALMAGTPSLADAFLYFGLLLVFLVLPVVLFILGIVSWSALLALAVMELGVVVCVMLEDRYEEQLIEPS